MRTRTPANSIGQTQHLVTFEDPGVPVSDGRGGYTYAWTPLTPALWYVRIRPATARDAERAIAGTVITHVSHVVHGRYHPGVTTTSRMTTPDGRVYQITSAINLDERDEEMELVADLQT